jgi:hypothetical protein
MKKHVWVVPFAVCLAIFMLGCTYMQSRFTGGKNKDMMDAYAEAKRWDDVIYYEDFLKKYPDSPFAAEVYQRAMELSYEEATHIWDNIFYYEEFLKKYPDSPFAPKVR